MQRKFIRDSLICLLPCLYCVYAVIHAYYNDSFKLGIDLVGGTILIYEVDQERERQRQSLDKGGGNFKRVETSQALAEAVKRRIDPTDMQNIIVRPAGENRIEVVLPTGSHNSSGKQNVTQGDVAKIRNLIEQVGSLEFRIVANEHDDGKAFAQTEELFAKTTPEKFKQLAEGGDPPPTPVSPRADPWDVHGTEPTYAWVELSKAERRDLGLLNRYESEEEEKKDRDKVKGTDNDHSWLWRPLEEARKNNRPFLYNTGKSTMMMCSRECLNLNLSPEMRKEKKYEYFILTRASDSVKVDGTHVTITATPGTDSTTSFAKPIIQFTFNREGGQQFYKVTSENKPDQEGRVVRHLAIILNGELISFPSLNAAISEHGMISGNFDQDYVNEIVKLLRSGALPATLKQKPVSENTIGPTLGEDTIKSGRFAILVSFIAILVFMLVYYWFAGFVACVALLANLLLTVGFMVTVSATFTLPGLAGLVLMLGMAVDANVLIYERLREERDRGANLANAIRAAYDRAFPTIIDTHLSSIFTAVVLYVFGNDQLRGFGISLTAGLIISLFTSLFMTRLLFDIWQKRHWLKKLRMLRLLSKPNIDFMKIRNLMFATTGALTILGLALFLVRGERGLNVDFVGGTVYGGQLRDAVDIGTLRDRLSENRQREVLKVASVKRDETAAKSGRDVYLITYADGQQRRVELALGVEGDTPEQKEANLVKRAEELPDWSVEQNFLSDNLSDKSPLFTVRTTEKEPDLVEAAIDRLFSNGPDDSMLAQIKLSVTKDKEKDSWQLKFTDAATGDPRYASEAYLRTLLEREFRAKLPAGVMVLEPFRLGGEGEPKDGRYSEMKLSLSSDMLEKAPSLDTDSVLNRVATEFNQRPQPERLETFDPALASEMRTRASVAILASWIAILLYLWFRFGNWTFGLAAVICLIHDLCFTLGAIAICHFLYDTPIGTIFGLQDFKIDFVAIAALLTLVGYSVNDTIVVFDRIREVRGKNPLLTSQMINDSVNQTLSRTVLAATTVFLVVVVLYCFGGSGIHLFAYVMVIGVLVGTYSSIYVASPLLLIFGEGQPAKRHVPAPTVAAPSAPKESATPV